MNNETKRGTYSVHDLVRISVLVAIMLLLEVTGLGMIKMPGLEITLLMVPVIVGAIVMGPATGAILGGVFGCISFWECFGRSQFGAMLLGINPLYTFLVCVPTRILAGWLCGCLLYTSPALLKVNINTASAEELDGLPGIGPVLAQRIVDEREANGSYTGAEDLTRVEGIGQAIVESIQDHIITEDTQE